MKAAAAAATAAENNAGKKELRIRFHDCFVFEQSKKTSKSEQKSRFLLSLCGSFFMFALKVRIKQNKNVKRDRKIIR
ncbi:hypothetical protein [Holdemania filiformis]|jgi:hypothetical protein|uniref:hypothetical protein n=1 Tax=Holdemania filiformis TaxID=61171 RepID=UPI0026753E49|nr:hypothetical protein [Holdemania filiformis]